MRPKRLPWDERFNRRTATRRVDNAYRDAQFRVQRPSEIKRYTRKTRHRCWRAEVPRCRGTQIVQRVRRFAFVDSAETDRRQIRGGDVGLDGLQFLGHRAGGHRHVGLAAGVPDLAHDDIADLEVLACTADSQFPTVDAGSQGAERGRPGAVIAAHRFGCLAGKLDSHFLALIGPSPNLDWSFTLKNQMVRKDAGQPHLGPGIWHDGKQQGQQ